MFSNLFRACRYKNLIHLNVNIRGLETKTKMHRKSIYKTEEAKKVRFYILHRYVEYLKNYDKVLDKSFPGAMHVYRVFTMGVRDFMRDLKEYVKIVRLLYGSKQNYPSLNRREIELYHQMPKDMRKIAPVLLLSALPFANYVIFPLAYLLPRHLLTSHFWTLQQRSEFSIMLLTNRLSHNKPVFRFLQEQLPGLKGHPLYEPWRSVLGRLGSGAHPTPAQIVQCKDLFMGDPYHLLYLRGAHVKHLVRMHELHGGWFKRTRLAERAVILKEMDKAIMREGGVHNLPIDALKRSCSIRGLNPTNLSNDEMVTWLNDWITVSNAVDKESLSLLLHCPVLLGYNEPTNWVLIYKDKGNFRNTL